MLIARVVATEIGLVGPSENQDLFCKMCINLNCTFKKVCGIVKVKFEMVNNSM